MAQRLESKEKIKTRQQAPTENLLSAVTETAETEAQVLVRGVARGRINRAIDNALHPVSAGVRSVAPTADDQKFAAAILARESGSEFVAESVTEGASGSVMETASVAECAVCEADGLLDSISVAVGGLVDGVSDSLGDAAEVVSGVAESAADVAGGVVDAAVDVAGGVVSEVVESLVD